jgi:hypothetical protein
LKTLYNRNRDSSFARIPAVPLFWPFVLSTSAVSSASTQSLHKASI